MPNKAANIVTKYGVRYADNLLSGIVFTAVLVTLSTLFGVPLYWVATAFIVLVHTRHDLSQSAPLALVAMLTTFFITQSLIAVIPFIALMLAADIYKKHGSIMLSYEVLIVLAILSVVIIHLLFPDIASWWLERFEPIKKLVLNEKTIEPKQVEDVFSGLSRLATGLAAMSAIYSAMLGLVIGLIWEALIKNSNKIYAELLNAKMGLMVPIIGLFGVAAWLLKYNWMVDITPVIFGSLALYGAYVLLCVSWYLFKKSVWIYIMIILSLFLFMISDIFKIFIVLLAITDYFADWREIFKKVSVDT